MENGSAEGVRGGGVAPIKTALKCNYSAVKNGLVSNLLAKTKEIAGLGQLGILSLCGKSSGKAGSALCEVITGTSRGQRQSLLMITPLLGDSPC